MSSNINDFLYFLMHQTNKLKTEACLEVLREAGGELRIFMLDIYIACKKWEGGKLNADNCK